MLNAIPNPKKNFEIPFSISKTFEAVQSIPGLAKKYKLTKSNNAFKSCTLEAYELLSLGVFIDFNLNEVSDNKTGVTIEVRRKVGTFDQWHEVTNANEHIDKLCDYLSDLVVLSDEELENLKTLANEGSSEPAKKWYQYNFLLLLSTLFLFPVGVYGIYKKISTTA
jgi:tetrahydromethanopterin S-methyltransferase subunit B